MGMREEYFGSRSREIRGKSGTWEVGYRTGGNRGARTKIGGRPKRLIGQAQGINRKTK